MSDTLVSARVTRAKKERAGGVLASLGATTSDLINDAFDFVIARKQLPCASGGPARAKGDFASFVKASTLDVPWPDGFGGDYRELVKRGRLADYESLA